MVASSYSFTPFFRHLFCGFVATTLRDDARSSDKASVRLSTIHLFLAPKGFLSGDSFLIRMIRFGRIRIGSLSVLQLVAARRDLTTPSERHVRELVVI